MPRIVSTSEKLNLINLILEKDKTGEPKYGQRELEQVTGLSRPYIRKISKELNHQFPRNGIERKGTLFMCTNCGDIKRRPLSKLIRAGNNFCDDNCRIAYQTGPNHPSWKVGSSAKTFSEWVKNQKEYKQWRQEVLARAGFKCEVSGRTENLDCHHICEKAINNSKAFDADNGIVLNEEIHIEIHKLTREGKSFEEAIEILREKYGKAH